MQSIRFGPKVKDASEGCSVSRKSLFTVPTGDLPLSFPNQHHEDEPSSPSAELITSLTVKFICSWKSELRLLAFAKSINLLRARLVERDKRKFLFSSRDVGVKNKLRKGEEN
jgi:hypothetical protein